MKLLPKESNSINLIQVDNLLTDKDKKQYNLIWNTHHLVQRIWQWQQNQAIVSPNIQL